MIVEYIAIIDSQHKKYNSVSFKIPDDQKSEHEELVNKYNRINSSNIFLAQNFFQNEYFFKECEKGANEILELPDSDYCKDNKLNCILIAYLKRRAKNKKRTILEDKLYELVTVEGIIEKHGNLKFDGYDRMVTTKLWTEYFNPIRKYDDGCIDVLYHKNMTTLLRDCKIDGKSISDGHLWFPMNLSYNNDLKIGDKIKIIGHVEMYERQDGTYDYCINPTRVEKCNT